MKKVLLITITLVVAVATVPLFAAFEAHVINVTAHIENALKVIPPDEISFGTVFPQEYHQKHLWVTTSESFCAGDQRRVLNIDYKIVQKPKCVNDAGEYAVVNYWDDECPDNYTELPLLCPYLSKTPVYEDPEPYTDYGVPAFHGPEAIATGTINKDHDLSDEWILDLAVPCFEGYCSQDWDEFVLSINPNADPDAFMLPYELESETFGCDLWIEVTDIY